MYKMQQRKSLLNRPLILNVKNRKTFSGGIENSEDDVYILKMTKIKISKFYNFKFENHKKIQDRYRK